MVLGRCLAEFFVARFSGSGAPKSRTFDGRGFYGDFCFEKVLDMAYIKKNGRDVRSKPDDNCNIGEGASLNIPQSEQLYYLWEQALAECRLIIHPQAGHES
jgi:hypothetical protein